MHACIAGERPQSPGVAVSAVAQRATADMKESLMRKVGGIENRTRKGIAPASTVMK